jgi:2-oxoglutarate/2-oxoacid ferredoxin oxidoreductase subunit alpha
VKGDRVLMRGSDIAGEAAVRAGCRYYFGYPITPQNELPEYLASRLPEVGGVFIQAESEIASINMLLGASAAGGRVMTSSSSPGISLMQEGVSYMAASELPAVIVNMMRGGPGLGNIAPSAADYFQATRGGGHGDYRTPVLAPGDCQELAELTFVAFDLADKYRTPVMLLGDGLMGQVMEPVVFPDPIDLADLPAKDWILDGCAGREPRIIFSYHAQYGELYRHTGRLQAKYDAITAHETRWETYLTEDADIIVVAYGTASRIARSAIDDLREEGLKIGLFRPITLWPFPKDALREAAKAGRSVAVFELCLGQMVEDVALSVNKQDEIHFLGVPGGGIPTPADVTEFLESIMEGNGRVGRRIAL